MITRICILGLALGVAVGLHEPTAAKDYNKRPFLPPSGQAKVNNARASVFATQAEIERKSKEAGEQGQLCRDEETGVIVDRRNPRRETIIATQDIVNLGGQLELGANCR